MFTKSDSGIITFDDTSKITPKQWSLMIKRLNYIGYGFESENEVKEYFDRHRPLGKDQSDVVLSVLLCKPFKFRINGKKKLCYLTKSVKEFGTTTKWNCAGYILTDGTILDFSGGQYRRTCDHRDIKSVVKHPRIIEPFSFNTSAMIEFINYGHIRCQLSGFETATRLTPEQKQAIRNYMVVNGNVFIDIVNWDGYSVKHLEYAEWCPTKMFNDIDHYFDSLES